MLAWGICMAVAFTVFVFRRSIASWFTQDVEVQAMLISTIPVLSLTFFPDSAQGILSATVRALGQQGKAAGFALFTFYVVGGPVGVILAFWAGLDITGLWLGTMSAVILQSIVFLRIIVKTDW